MKSLSIRVRLFLSVIILSAASLSLAGDLNAPASPTEPGSAMFTLEDLYNRLNTGVTGAKRSGPFAEPTAAPGSTMHNLNDIMNKAPVVDNSAGAGVEHILAGKTYWGLQSSKWGLQTGTMANIGAINITPSAATQTITAGFHDGDGKVAGDTDLVAGNIRAGVDLFGVVGTSEVVNTTSANATAGELLFNRTAWVNGHEITGTMANIGAINFTPSAATQTITAGFHDGAGKVAGDTDLVAGNIRAGVELFGVVGTSAVVNTTSANATAGELLFNRTAWVNGQAITGTLANIGAMNITASAAEQTITAGFHDGTGKVAGDADLVTGNIRAGVNLFGVNGNAAVVNTSSGNATAGELLYTRTAWINGQEITGTRLGGVILKAGGSFSPQKRWYDNADGTITDVTTGLVWLKNLPVADRTFTATPTDQIDCFRFCGELQNGTNGLTDGSRLNDWRPPTIREMQSMRTGTEPIGGGNWQLFPNYSGIGSYSYWTVSQDNVEPGKVQTIHMTTGVLVPKYRMSWGGDSIRGLVWPVRNAFLP